MDQSPQLLPFVVTITDCFLPLMAPVVLEVAAEYEPEVVQLVTGTMIAMAELEITLN